MLDLQNPAEQRWQNEYRSLQSIKTKAKLKHLNVTKIGFSYGGSDKNTDITVYVIIVLRKKTFITFLIREKNRRIFHAPVRKCSHPHEDYHYTSITANNFTTFLFMLEYYCAYKCIAPIAQMCIFTLGFHTKYTSKTHHHLQL